MANQEQMLQQVLAQMGVSSPDALNRARNFYAANPDQLERKYMGMPGANYEGNAPMDFSTMLDKIANDTAPKGTVTVGPLEEAKPQQVQQQAPVAKKVAPQQQSNPNQRSEDLSGVTPPVGQLPPTAKGGDSWLDKLWPAILGVMAVKNVEDVGANYNKANPQLQSQQVPPQRQLTYQPNETKALPAPDPKLENKRSVVVPEDQKLTEAGQARAGRDAKVAADVNAENASAQALMEQIKAQMTAQERAAALGQAARRATGRK